MAAPTPRKFEPVVTPLTPPQSPPPEKRTQDERSAEAVDIPDNYVQHTLAAVPPLPPIRLKNLLNEVQWISLFALTMTPLLSIYGGFTTTLKWQTFVFSVFWYFVTG